MQELQTACEWLIDEVASNGSMIDAAIEQMQEQINFMRETLEASDSVDIV